MGRLEVGDQGQGGAIRGTEAKASPGTTLYKPPGAEMSKDQRIALLPQSWRADQGETTTG